MARFAVIDFETSGLAPDAGDRALEIAAVIVEDGAIVDSWQSLMNPGIRVPHFITQLTGISPLMVRMAPPPAEVMAAVARFVGDATVVAHNASFDRKFWQFELGRIRTPCDHDFLCTLLLSRRLYPWSLNHKLATLVDLHKIPVEGQYHRALADASMTAHLFITMQRDLERLYAGETIDTDFLLKYQKTTKNQVKATSGAPARYE
ncbi:MAG: 3'-5' exonuclease [Moraxellaceae bacterium]|nr:3'-5' exonuclease [Moraxellaceae bacterium]MBP9045858.1 3'-5' exonuclease [Moraxellaceae bacterium]MBP9731091.1 3'-5' exonuclease [Moraxellaceae bacterium]MCC6199249.1 3'-5' exonuclease [Moraxellaceae bacterium]